MPSVLFISKGLAKPSTRYRASAFFARLEAAGWEPGHVEAGHTIRDRRAVLAAARGADVVVVLRKTFGGIFRRRLRAAAPRLVFDLDDAIFVRDDGRASRLRRRRFAAMASACDAVWAGNGYLAEAGRALGADVVVLPTAVEPARYRPAGSRSAATTDLVWIGSGSTRKYLERVAPALAGAAARVPKLRLNIIADFTLAVPGLAVRPIPWADATETRDLAASHIGIAPMTEDAWTRGKCGLKVLQYMAARLPVVAERAGVHRDIVVEGETGSLVDTADDWADAIATLAGDSAKRDRMGSAGRARVQEHYSVDAVFERMRGSLEALTRNRRG